MGGVLLIGALLALGGYTVGWDGWLMLRGYSGPNKTGPGLSDLILPSRIGALEAALKAGPGQPASSAANPPPGSGDPSGGTFT